MKIEHVAAYFNDLEGAKAFFEQYFSASAGELYRNPRTGFCSYFLTFDGGARLVRLWYLEPPETLRGQARAKPVLQSKPGRPAPSGARPQSAIP